MDPDSLTYRQATGDDAERIIEHMARMLGDPSIKMCPSSYALPDLEFVRDWLADKFSFCFIAELNDHVRGYVQCFGLEDPDRAALAISIEQGFRWTDQENKIQTSVAQRLMHEAIHWCHENSVATLEGCVHPENAASLALFARNSFVAKGRCSFNMPDCDPEHQIYLIRATQ